ncbi:DNA cytosine methyltransferase [Yinghuangia sp. KLBMP8922]|uniref:DNA (cytosine-5-)-methyltransferase n=1 Tax=Yinghuangia soli TaxID=2908204 RepID=A0AA41Q6X3_9ACTN|nr:DNA cytosine methyltransferase [Yinghuangia soli]
MTDVVGGSVLWHADNAPAAAAVLARHWPGVPNLGDIKTVDWQSVPPVDLVTAGYPCQPFSSAGQKKGVNDARHLWPHVARALGLLRPRWVVLENVGHHLRLGFDVVLGDLARLGFDARWCCVRASDVGAAHERRRLFVLAWDAAVADPAGLGPHRSRTARERRAEPAHRGPAVADPGGAGLEVRPVEPAGHQRQTAERGGADDVGTWGHYAAAVATQEAATRPAPRPVDDLGRLNPGFSEWLMGLPAGWVADTPGLSRTAQLTVLGNGVVPAQAAAALNALIGESW